MNKLNNSEMLKDVDYMVFFNAGEDLVYETAGILDNKIKGNIVLTSKKLFFYFITNISREKVFIATHPNIKSVELKIGFRYAMLTISNKSSSFKISNINKDHAKELYSSIDKIIQENI